MIKLFDDVQRLWPSKTEDQDASGRRVVQPRPGQLDLLQLAQTVLAEILNGAIVAGLGRVHSELPIDLLPGEPLGSAKREGPVDKPEVQVEAQRRTLERREGVHVERHRVVDDLL